MRISEFWSQEQLSRARQLYKYDPSNVRIGHTPKDGRNGRLAWYSAMPWHVPDEIWIDKDDFNVLDPNDPTLGNSICHELMHWEDYKGMNFIQIFIWKIWGRKDKHGVGRNLEEFRAEAKRRAEHVYQS